MAIYNSVDNNRICLRNGVTISVQNNKIDKSWHEDKYFLAPMLLAQLGVGRKHGLPNNLNSQNTIINVVKFLH